VSCEGEGTGRRRAGAAAGRTLAWRDAGGVMRARVHGHQRGNGGSCAGPRMRGAGYSSSRQQAAEGRKRERKPAQKKKEFGKKS
jgi:hypothetical protein